MKKKKSKEFSIFLENNINSRKCKITVCQSNGNVCPFCHYRFCDKHMTSKAIPESLKSTSLENLFNVLWTYGNKWYDGGHPCKGYAQKQKQSEYKITNSAIQYFEQKKTLFFQRTAEFQAEFRDIAYSALVGLIVLGAVIGTASFVLAYLLQHQPGYFTIGFAILAMTTILLVPKILSRIPPV